MRKLRGLLTFAIWRLHRFRMYFVKVSWIGVIALVLVASYLYSEARLGLRNRSITEVSAAALANFVPARGTEVRLLADFRLADYWVGKDGDSEIYYSLLRASTGSVLVRSSLPVENSLASVEGLFEPLEPDVRASISRSYPSVPEVVLQIGKRPLSPWLSIPALLLTALVLAHFLCVLFGYYGFKPKPLPANANTLAERAIETLRSKNYLSVTWAHRSLGDLEAAAIFSDDALHVATSMRSTYEVGDFELEGGNKTIKAVVLFRELEELTFGTIPVLLHEHYALMIRGRKEVVLFSKAPEPLLGIMFLLKYFRENSGSLRTAAPPAASAANNSR